MGDFNVAPNVHLDRKNSTYYNNNAARLLQAMKEEYGFCDIWRMRNNNERRYSWYRSKQASNIIEAARIDYAVIPTGLSDQVHDVFYFTGIMTDHSAFFLGLDLKPTERGPCYWKMNTSLLQDRVYLEQINCLIDRRLELYQTLKPDEKWDMLKADIQMHTKNYTKGKTSERNMVIEQLMDKVEEFEERIDYLSQEEFKLLNDTKADLENELFERTKGIMFQSRAKWMMEAERNTRYFYSLEKNRSKTKTCNVIFKDETTNSLTDNPVEILKVQQQYYTQLYTADPNIEFQLTNETSPEIPRDSLAASEDKLSAKEIAQAVRKLANNKTPGPDGIPIDFYKVFWEKIGGTVCEVIEYGYTENILHPSARQGILNLIPKPEKDSRLLKNLRPITILNSDYKIVEKALSERMVKVMDNIINYDQRGFLLNRRIAAGIRRVYDIILQMEEQKMEGILLNLDFSKAFDKLENTAIQGSLKYFGFSYYIRRWFRILYSDFSVRVQNNGFFSEKIPITRSVHQGAPASSLLFIVAAETLAIELRRNPQIKGIFINDIVNFLNQYADDMSLC